MSPESKYLSCWPKFLFQFIDFGLMQGIVDLVVDVMEVLEIVVELFDGV